MCKRGYFCAAPWYTNMAMDKWVTFRTCISHYVLHFCRKDPKRIVVYWEKIGPLEWCISALRNIWVFQKYGYPQIIHFNRVFHYKPSILGYPFFWKHPCMYIYIYIYQKKVPLSLSQRTSPSRWKKPPRCIDPALRLRTLGFVLRMAANGFDETGGGTVETLWRGPKFRNKETVKEYPPGN